MTETPSWIREIVDKYGGWAVPLFLGPGHPIITESWSCFHCNKPFGVSDVAVVMPLPDDDTWTAEHRTCLLSQLGSKS